MVAEFHVYAGCKKGIVTGQYKGGNGPSRVKMDEKLVLEAFNRIENTPLTPGRTEELVSSVLKQLGLKEIETNSDSSGIEGEEPSITRKSSELQTYRFLAQQMQARTEASTSSPTFINAPHKAP